jgi:hypothetical protein
MANNDEHAITAKFKTFNKSKKISFFWLTKFMYILQENKKFNLLNFQGHSCNFLQNIENIFDEQKYWFICDIYKKYEIFEEIVKYMTKTTKCKKMPRKLGTYLTNNEEKEYFLRFINAISLVNLIKKQLKNKCSQKINDYQLFNQLNSINANAVLTLNLTQLNYLSDRDQIDSWLNNTYNYENANLIYLIDNINEDEYNKIYELFYKFL